MLISLKEALPMMRTSVHCCRGVAALRLIAGMIVSGSLLSLLLFPPSPSSSSPSSSFLLLPLPPLPPPLPSFLLLKTTLFPLPSFSPPAFNVTGSGEPIIYHGYTLTTKLPFREVIQTIKVGVVGGWSLVGGAWWVELVTWHDSYTSVCA